VNGRPLDTTRQLLAWYENRDRREFDGRVEARVRELHDNLTAAMRAGQTW